MGMTNSLKHINALHKGWPHMISTRGTGTSSMDVYLQMIDPKSQNLHDWAECVIMENHTTLAPDPHPQKTKTFFYYLLFICVLCGVTSSYYYLYYNRKFTYIFSNAKLIMNTLETILILKLNKDLWDARDIEKLRRRAADERAIERRMNFPTPSSTASAAQLSASSSSSVQSVQQE